MPILVPVPASTPPSSSATTSVQNILDCASQDLRSQLPTNSSILIDYTNRISLDLMRHSRWKWLLSGVKQFTTTIGSSDYWIGATSGFPGAPTINTALDLGDIRVIKADSVFERTNWIRLARTEGQPLGQQFTQNGRVKLWRNDVSTPGVLSIYPPPNTAVVIEFRYYKIHVQLTLVGQTLQIPDDYKDIVCAGVTWIGYKFLQKDEDAQHWFSVYQDGKRQIIKDANLFPRAGEFIYPDPSSVVRNQISGLGLDSGLESSIP